MAEKIVKDSQGLAKDLVNDCISRQAAIEQIEATFPVDPHANAWAEGVAIGAALAKQFISTLPSAQPERKKGEWIPVTNGRGGFECDQCHNYAPSYQDGVEWLSGFCPNCGADMREVDDERPD